MSSASTCPRRSLRRLHSMRTHLAARRAAEHQSLCPRILPEVACASVGSGHAHHTRGMGAHITNEFYPRVGHRGQIGPCHPQTDGRTTTMRLRRVPADMCAHVLCNGGARCVRGAVRTPRAVTAHLPAVPLGERPIQAHAYPWARLAGHTRSTRLASERDSPKLAKVTMAASGPSAEIDPTFVTGPPQPALYQATTTTISILRFQSVHPRVGGRT